MTPTRTIAALALAALALLAGCNDAGFSPTTSTSAPATTKMTASTTKFTEALKAALLTPADVPGATVVASPSEDFDLSACAPDNPFAARTDPTEVKNTGLELKDGAVNRQYSSKAREGTPEQAKALVAAFSATCVVDSFKKLLSLTPPPSFDTSGLTGTAATAAVADGGGVVSIAGPLKKGRDEVSIVVDLLVFQKGSFVVFVSASAVDGPMVPGQSLELARKIESRLP